MLQNFTSELKQLNQGNVHIKDRAKVNQIINNFVTNGFNRLQIVSDFDKTITKQHENGKIHMSSFGMFNKCPSLPITFIEKVTALADKYVPIEVDPGIPLQEKYKLMEEWWTLSEEALKGIKVSQTEIEEVCSSLGPSLRDGSQEFFEKLFEYKVPVLVFSAGLGDTVVAVLKQSNVLKPNVKVISNFLHYDNEGSIKGFSGPLIHVFNKNEFALKGTEFYNLILERDNVILLGDSIGDASMADGISHSSNVLKIGFLYERQEEALPLYMDTFDIVLVDDQTMDVAKAILDCIENSSNVSN